MLIEISYVSEGAETKEEIKQEETLIIDCIKEMIANDWHDAFSMKIKKVKNDTSRVQNCKK